MILVTGANGFVGQHLVPELKKTFPRQKIVCLTYQPRKAHEIDGLKILKKLQVDLIKIDLLNKKTLTKIPQNPAIVIHLAASVDTSEGDFSTNDIGTKNLLEAVGRIGKSTKFIFISTAAVWTGRKDYSKPITESEIALVNNEYGRTKLKAENFLQTQADQSGFALTILRLNTVYGADSRKDKLFGVMKNYILQGSIFSRLNWPGQFGIIHVMDVVGIIIALCKQNENAFTKDNLYLVSAENISLQEISRQMHQAMGYNYSQIKLPMFMWVIGRKMLSLLPLLESILPPYFFNFFWRANLAINDILKANPSKVKRKFPGIIVRRFVDSVEEVISV